MPGRQGADLRTAHDLSEGGFLIALAEACLGRRLGARVEVPLAGADLFSETQGRAIVACSPAALDRVLQAAEELGVPAREIGEVGGDDLVVRTGGEILQGPRRRPPRDLVDGAAQGPGAVGELAVGEFRQRRFGLTQRSGTSPMCGIFGIDGCDDAANLTYLGLYALQHRGQESAGIVSWDGAQLHLERGMGHVSDIFKEKVIARLPGRAGARPHPLLDGGLERGRQRAADRRSRPRWDRSASSTTAT